MSGRLPESLELELSALLGGRKVDLNMPLCRSPYYGRQQRKSESKGDYTKLCGQRFWQFISGDAELYTRIIEPLGHRAKERNDFFQAQYELVIDAFTQDFRRDFCDPTNSVLWKKLAQFTSAEVPPKLSPKSE